ncbi:hypothetical protein DYB32_010236, partial [Aphanomyces invadans]
MLRQSEAHVQVLLAKNKYLERQVEVAVRSSVRRDLEIMRRRADLEQEEVAHRARVLRHAAENRVQATTAAAANPSQTPEQTRDPVTGHLYTPAYVESLIRGRVGDLYVMTVACAQVKVDIADASLKHEKDVVADFQVDLAIERDALQPELDRVRDELAATMVARDKLEASSTALQAEFDRQHAQLDVTLQKNVSLREAFDLTNQAQTVLISSQSDLAIQLRTTKEEPAQLKTASAATAPSPAVVRELETLKVQYRELKAKHDELQGRPVVAVPDPMVVQERDDLKAQVRQLRDSNDRLEAVVVSLEEAKNK